MSLQKGTIIVRSKGNVYGVDEGRVEYRLNESWNKAYLTTRGYSLPLALNDRVTISFMRPGYSEVTRLIGYVNRITNRDEGKQFRQEVEIFGDGAKTAYKIYSPTSSTVVDSDLISAMMVACGLPLPVTQGLGRTISITTGNRYVEDYLRDLVNKNSINYYWTYGNTLVAFLGTFSTYSSYIGNFIVREKVSDETNVFNSITLKSTIYEIGETDDYCTENSIQNWDYNHFTYRWAWERDSWSESTFHPGSCPVAIKGNYSASFPLDTLKPNLTPERAYLRISFETIPINLLQTVRFYIALKADSSGIGVPDGTTLYYADVYVEIYYPYNPYLPPELIKNHYPPGQKEYMFRVAQYPVGKIPIVLNSVNWNTVSFNVKNDMDNLGIDPESSWEVGYLGIRIEKLATDIVANTTLSALVDGLEITREKWYNYSNTESINTYGLREKAPAMVDARKTSDFISKAEELLRNNLKAEESIRRLEFPGSLGFYPGWAVTLTFHDYTKVYMIQEVTDEFNGDDWRTVLSVSSSEVSVPKTDVIGKIKDMDRTLLDLENRVSETGFVVTNPLVSVLTVKDLEAEGLTSSYLLLQAGSIGYISTIGNIGTMNAEYIGQIGYIANINSINSIGSISTMNVDRIGNINSIGMIQGANFNWIYSVNNIGTISNISSMNVTKIGQIGTINKISYLNADIIGSIGTINTINQANIGIANISQIGGISQLTTGFLTVTNIATIATATISTAYITKVDSIATLNADKIFITSASIGAITNTISNFNAISAKIGTVNAIGELVALNANVTVNGSLDIPVGTVHVYNVVCDAFTLEAGSIRNMLVGTISGTSINFKIGTITTFMIGTITGQEINIHFGDIDEAVIDHIQGTVNIDILGTVQTVNAGFINVGTVNIKGGTLSNINITSGSMGTVSLYSGTIARLELTAPLIGKGVIRADNISFLPANYIPNPSFEYVDENGKLIDWDTNVTRISGGKDGNYAGVVNANVRAWSKVTIPTREGEIWSASGYAKCYSSTGARIEGVVLDEDFAPFDALKLAEGGGSEWSRLVSTKATIPPGACYIVPTLYASSYSATFDALELYKDVGSINIGSGVIDTPHLKANCVTSDQIQLSRISSNEPTKEGALYYWTPTDELRFIGQTGEKGYIPRFPLGVEASPSENLVPNPNFERIVDGKPVYWNVPSYGSISTDSKKGYYCVYAYTPNTLTYVEWSHDLVPIEEGAKLYASAWIKASSGYTLNLGPLHIAFFNKDKGQISEVACSDTTVTTSWKQFEVMGTAPTNTRYACVHLYARTSGQTLYYDDVVLSEIRAAVPTILGITDLSESTYTYHSISPNDTYYRKIYLNAVPYDRFVHAIAILGLQSNEPDPYARFRICLYLWDMTELKYLAYQMIPIIDFVNVGVEALVLSAVGHLPANHSLSVALYEYSYTSSTVGIFDMIKIRTTSLEHFHK